MHGSKNYLNRNKKRYRILNYTSKDKKPFFSRFCDELTFFKKPTSKIRVFKKKVCKILCFHKRKTDFQRN